MILEPANVAGDLAHISRRSQGAGTLAEIASCAFGHFFNHLQSTEFQPAREMAPPGVGGPRTGVSGGAANPAGEARSIKKRAVERYGCPAALFQTVLPEEPEF
jgi:hypothetical protein